MSRPVIVAIDGPAGSGKSSICGEVCRRLGWSYVNTGALYRAIALLVMEKQVSTEDLPALEALMAEQLADLRWDHHEQSLYLGKRCLSPYLGSNQVAALTSSVAKIPLVRQKLLPIQRQLGLSAEKGAMVEGRDIGTVIFPDADLKIFFTASIEERARRRLKQLDGDPQGFHGVLEAIQQRDEQDSSRGVAPFVQAPDAVFFDTSQMGEQEAVKNLLALLQDRGLAAR